MNKRISIWCKLGLHKWEPIGGTIRRMDRYTVAADVICARGCGAIGHGTKDEDY